LAVESFWQIPSQKTIAEFDFGGRWKRKLVVFCPLNCECIKTVHPSLIV
jgi:hypothetical protein